MKLEDIINLKELNPNSTERNKLLANIQVRGNWFFSVFKEALKPYGISEVQFNVLKILIAKHPDPVCIGEISGLLISQASDVTRIIDRMIKKGLVIRDIPEGNRRMVLVSLTDEGLKKIEETINVLDQVTAKTSVWTDQEVETINRLLDKLG